VIRHLAMLILAIVTLPAPAWAAPDVVRTSLYVPARDGVRLAVNIYRPAHGDRPVAERLPVIFAFTPYRARYREANGQIVELALGDRLALRSLIGAGYVVELPTSGARAPPLAIAAVSRTGPKRRTATISSNGWRDRISRPGRSA
jgi:hypothetical protein